MTSRLAVGIVLAAALALGACRGSVLPATPAESSRFENPVWGVKLAYPAEWTARAGKGMEPLVVELRAPGSNEAAGTGVTLVGFNSAAALDDMVAAYNRRLPSNTFSSRLMCGGHPAAAFDYIGRVDNKPVRTRSILIRAPERFMVATFAAYEPQYESVKPSFDLIEKSLEVAGE